MHLYDTIVVGLGAAGAATLYQLARSGQRVLGIDRFTPPHTHGSSHGETRLTRCAIGEGEAYVPLAIRSHEIWRELEAETGAALLDQCGMLIVTDPNLRAGYHGKEGFVQRTIAVAERCGIAHEVLDAAGIERRFPQMQVTGRELGYFEPGGGMIYPERCVEAQLTMARRLGAEVLCDTRIAAVQQDGPDAARVETEAGAVFRAAHVIVAAGSWTASLLGGPFPRHLTVTRQTFHWFDVEVPARFAPGAFPSFIWMYGAGEGESMYGFPVAPGGRGLKLGSEQFVDTTEDPDLLNRAVTAAESAQVYEAHVRTRLLGVLPRVVRSTTCIYTFTPDADFLIDAAPERENVLVVSACSGHGFKHSAALGEAVARRVTGAAGAGVLEGFRGARLWGAVPAI
jgi:sarcosine oxidase